MYRVIEESDVFIFREKGKDKRSFLMVENFYKGLLEMLRMFGRELSVQKRQSKVMIDLQSYLEHLLQRYDDICFMEKAKFCFDQSMEQPCFLTSQETMLRKDDIVNRCESFLQELAIVTQPILLMRHNQ